ncbi:MAG: hypothetical protein JW996_00740 [Candidatus Cloacimonetes bacterium]|nr:hypothetical protein [Candidatus Cloacimonadota bacterium]
MNYEDLKYYYRKFKFGDDNFHNLMKQRVKNILLISSIFDAYVLESDGRLSEQLHGEYRQLDLSTSPRIITVTFSDDILNILDREEIDLVIIMMRIGNITPFELSSQIRKKYPDLPLLLLLNKASYVDIVSSNPELLKGFNGVFLWRGDAKLFIAMIKLIEDKMNLDYDTKFGHIRVVLLIESAINYYSLFLPIFYAESMKLTQELIESELHDSNKRLRMRARPKVLLAHDYEDAISIYQKYKDYIICIITNVNLKVNDQFEQTGGIKLIREIRESDPDLPVMMQSADPLNRIEASKLNAEFVDKDSQNLLNEIRNFIVNNLGFGDFVFRNEQGEEIDRARSMYHFEKKIAVIPEESLMYHANRNHFSAWLMAHGEVNIAKQIRYVVASDFLNVDDIRKFLINTIHQVRKQQNRGKVVKFDPSLFSEEDKIIQLADGSLGGKGRGLSFLNALLVTMGLDKEFPDVEIRLPKTAIIGTNEFDKFLDFNRINTDKIIKKSDLEISEIFLKGELSEELNNRLRLMLEQIKVPLAIRSSGLLEDSQSQPFAGIYKTFMLPNDNPDPELRLAHLQSAVKMIFATPFQENPRKYIEGINYKIEEEKMAVVIQEIGGNEYEPDLFFPLFSGAAQSYNFYPKSGMEHSDGIAAVAVGLGKSVVDGERAYRYCPKHPRIDLLEPDGIVENSQRHFYALDLKEQNFNLLDGETSTLKKVRILEKHLQELFLETSSVWDHENFSFQDGKYVRGPRVITFRNVIHYNHFPLTSILLRLLDIGEVGLGVPVEIEFAVDLAQSDVTQTKPRFYILQIRPLSVTREDTVVAIDKLTPEDLVLYSEKAMGNGILKGIRDIVYVDPDKFDNTKTLEMVSEIDFINEKMKQENCQYILIGPGRWGSSDRFLGIPVNWAQINKAKIIVETSMEDYVIEASQGSHFFHNLVAMNIGYFTVHHNIKKNYLNWEWLKSQQAETTTEHVVHIRMPEAVLVKIDGKSGKAVILKENKSSTG